MGFVRRDKLIKAREEFELYSKDGRLIKKGLTQEEVASLCYMSRATYAGIELGRPCSLEKALQLSDFFGQPVRAFFAPDNEQNQREDGGSNEQEEHRTRVI